MTIDRMLFKGLLEKGSDADLLNEIMTFAVNRLMTLDVESLTGAAHGERSALRANHRNGCPFVEGHRDIDLREEAVIEWNPNELIGVRCDKLELAIANG